MNLEIEYPAFAINAEELVVDDIRILSLMDGKEDNKANISDHLSSLFEDLGVNGGQVKLKFNPDKNVLSSVVTYSIEQPLSKANLQKLIEETTGQLTDGYGETPWEINDNGQLFYIELIDLVSGEKYPISVSTLHDVSFIKKARRSPIFSAIEKGNILEAKKYMDRSHLFSTDKWGDTPLMCAISNSQIELAIEMIKLGSNVNHVAKKSGSTPLSIASTFGNFEVVKALIDYGVNVNETPKDPDGAHSGMTALMWSANRNYKSIVELLLNNGADINITNKNNETALMFSSQGSPEQIEIFELIIRRKPILTVKDWRGRTIIDEARDRAHNSGKSEMKNLIIKFYPEVIFE